MGGGGGAGTPAVLFLVLCLCILPRGGRGWREWVYDTANGPQGRRGHSMVMYGEPVDDNKWGGPERKHQIVLFGGRGEETQATHQPKTYDIRDEDGTLIFAVYDQKPVTPCDVEYEVANTTNGTIGYVYNASAAEECDYSIPVGAYYNDVWVYEINCTTPRANDNGQGGWYTKPHRYSDESCMGETGDASRGTWVQIHPGAHLGGCVMVMGTELCSTPSARWNHGAAMFNDSTMLIYGGFSLRCEDFCSDVWMFDMRDRSWIEIYPSGSLGYPTWPDYETGCAPYCGPTRRWRFSLLSDGANMVLYGGFRLWHGFSTDNEQANHWKNVDQYDEGGYMSDIWVFHKEMLPDEENVPTDPLDFGSWRPLWPQHECYDARGETWETRNVIECDIVWPPGRAGHVAMLDDDPRSISYNTMWIHGGYTTFFPYISTDGAGQSIGVAGTGKGGFTPYPDHPFYLDDLWMFNFSSGLWREILATSSTIPRPRMDHIMLLSLQESPACDKAPCSNCRTSRDLCVSVVIPAGYYQYATCSVELTEDHDAGLWADWGGETGTILGEPFGTPCGIGVADCDEYTQNVIGLLSSEGSCSLPLDAIAGGPCMCEEGEIFPLGPSDPKCCDWFPIFIGFGGYYDNMHFDDTWIYNTTNGYWLEKTTFVWADWPDTCTDDQAYIEEHNCTLLQWPQDLEREPTRPWDVMPWESTTGKWGEQTNWHPDPDFGPFWGIFPRQDSTMLCDNCESLCIERYCYDACMSAIGNSLSQAEAHEKCVWDENIECLDEDCFEDCTAECLMWYPTIDNFLIQLDPEQPDGSQLPDGAALPPFAASGPGQYARPLQIKLNATKNVTVWEFCTSVEGQPTRHLGELGDFDGDRGLSAEHIFIPQRRRRAPGWDGCRDRADGRTDLTNELQWAKPMQRSGHAGVYADMFGMVLFYGGYGYYMDQPSTTATTYPQRALDDYWQFNINSCPNNCSWHGECRYGFCVCDTGYYGVDCSNTSCPGDYCYFDEFRNQQFCQHCCQAGYNHTDDDVYQIGVRKVPCSDSTFQWQTSTYGESNGICDGWGTCQCAPPYIGEDCAIKDCPRNCSFNGWCSIEFPVSRCMCNPGFYGEYCQHRECLNNCSFPNGECIFAVDEETGLLNSTGRCDCSMTYDPYNNTREYYKWGGEDCSWRAAYAAGADFAPSKWLIAFCAIGVARALHV